MEALAFAITIIDSLRVKFIAFHHGASVLDFSGLVDHNFSLFGIWLQAGAILKKVTEMMDCSLL